MKLFYVFFSIIFATLISTASIAIAQDVEETEEVEPVEMFDTDRNLYLVTINNHGAILKSEEAEETLFIGNDCDVVSPKHGKGSWLWAEKGIIVRFKDRRFIFGRQKLAVKNNGKCEMAL